MKLRHGNGWKAPSHGTQSTSKCSVTNRYETFRCQACGRGVKRKSRQQRFCSDRCRNYAHRNAPSQINGRTALKVLRGTKTAEPLRTPIFYQAKLRGPKSGASIALNVLGGHHWPNAVGVERGLLRQIVRAEIGDTR